MKGGNDLACHRLYLASSLIWNSDGLGSPTKHLAISEAVHEHHLDFVAIFETRRSNFATPFLKSLAEGGGGTIKSGTAYPHLEDLVVFSLVFIVRCWLFRR